MMKKIVCISLLALLILSFILDLIYPASCTEYKTISSIVKVHGKSVAVVFTDNTTTNIYNPFVSVGEKLCTKWERQL